MGAFLALIKCHLVSPPIKSAEGLDVRQQRKAACQPRRFLKFAHLQDRPSFFDEGRDVIFCKGS